MRDLSQSVSTVGTHQRVLSPVLVVGLLVNSPAADVRGLHLSACGCPTAIVGSAGRLRGGLASCAPCLERLVSSVETLFMELEGSLVPVMAYGTNPSRTCEALLESSVLPVGRLHVQSVTSHTSSHLHSRRMRVFALCSRGACSKSGNKPGHVAYTPLCPISQSVWKSSLTAYRLCGDWTCCRPSM